MKYCLARRRSLRARRRRRRPEILIDRGNESSAISPACVAHDHRCGRIIVDQRADTRTESV